jgi:hypothetical protein
MAAALAVAFPAYADADLDALRAELKEMKIAYEARIQALEARLAGVEAPARNAVQADEPPTTAASSATAFNPEISLILQGSYAHLQDLPARRITGFFPNGTPEGATRGFSANESELVVAANVDPYFRGYFNAVLNDDTIGVEEAWFQTLALGEGLTVKGGRFRSGIGYQNEQHPHAWDFATNNLMYEALFGEGYGNDGLQLKWVAPTELYTELGAEIGRGANFPGTDRNENGVGSYALFGHLGGDVGVSHSWRAGLSYLHARARDRAGELTDINDVSAATLFSGNNKTWLADFVWKWAPEGNAVERNFKFAAEYFRREESGQLQCVDLDLPADPSLCGVDPGSTGDYAATQSGFYAQGVYQFMPRWRSGYRYDRLNPGSVDFGANSALLPVTDTKPTRHSLMLDYSPSEFSRLRLQVSKNKSMEGVSENQWFVQYIHSLGSHGAHKF